MNHKDFMLEVEMQFDRCKQVLEKKKDQYAPGADRLSNFKKAAHLQDVTPIAALFGMLSKHLVGLSDLIEEYEADEAIGNNIDLWLEYITDSINYLLLLRALLSEELPSDNGDE